MIETANNLQTIVSQIREDEKRLSAGEPIGNIALEIPRINSGEFLTLL
jgi:hypothetical protein